MQNILLLPQPIEYSVPLRHFETIRIAELFPFTTDID